MPASRTTKQYVVRMAAGDNQTGVAPSVNGVSGATRVGLSIQNTGINPGTYKWESPIGSTTPDAGAFLLAAGEKHDWIAPNCPQERLSCQSTLGTTFAIAETTDNG